jgi:hypothetical protein
MRFTVHAGTLYPLPVMNWTPPTGNHFPIPILPEYQKHAILSRTIFNYFHMLHSVTQQLPCHYHPSKYHATPILIIDKAGTVPFSKVRILKKIFPEICQADF